MQHDGAHHRAAAAAANRLGEIARLARDASGLAAAEVNLVDDHAVTTLASSGGALHRRPRHETLCAIAVERSGTTVMPDTWLDPEACRTAAARGAVPVRSYVAALLQDADGTVIGTLCVHDPSPHRTADVDLGLLADLALLTEGELLDAGRRAG